MVNRHVVIVIVSIAIIAGSLGYSSLNVLSAKDLEFGWPHQSFQFTSVIVGKTMSVCNNSDYPATFRQYSFTLIYDKDNLGTYSTGSGAFGPHSGGVVFGKFESTDERVSNIFLSFMDTEEGGTDITRIDIGKMKVDTKIDTTIMGVIPFSVTHEYSGMDFVEMLNKKPSCA